MTMKALVNMCVVGMLTLVATSERGLAQSTATAEARLKELNITLPPVLPPVANYVDSVRVDLRLQRRPHPMAPKHRDLAPGTGSALVEGSADTVLATPPCGRPSESRYRTLPVP
jgi:hypothetical protein